MFNTGHIWAIRAYCQLYYWASTWKIFYQSCHIVKEGRNLIWRIFSETLSQLQTFCQLHKYQMSITYSYYGLVSTAFQYCWVFSKPKIFLACHRRFQVSLFILKWKNCQQNPPGSLNVFYILVIHTDNAQVIFVLIEVCQPGGAAINFSKIARNQNQTTLLL